MAKVTKPRKAYSAPKLIVYGDMIKFTAGGTGTSNEGSGTDPTKHP
jgi:hypothetical protein